MKAGQKVLRGLLVARCDGPVVLDLIEEALDDVAFAVEREIAIALDFRFDLGGMTTVTARAIRLSTKWSASYPLSASRAFGSASASSASACVMSWTCPPVRRSASGLPTASTIAWIFDFCCEPAARAADGLIAAH